jgi:hypothetical protein
MPAGVLAARSACTVASALTGLEWNDKAKPGQGKVTWRTYRTSATKTLKSSERLGKTTEVLSAMEMLTWIKSAVKG